MIHQHDIQFITNETRNLYDQRQLTALVTVAATVFISEKLFNNNSAMASIKAELSHEIARSIYSDACSELEMLRQKILELPNLPERQLSPSIWDISERIIKMTNAMAKLT